MWNDERGADTIPLKLVVYLVIIGIIITMAAAGLKNAGPAMDTALIERQLGEFKSSVELMQSGYARPLSDPDAPGGNIRNFELVLPDSLEYLAFGVDPDPDNNGILTDVPHNLTTGNGSVIYYKLRNKGKTIVMLDDSIRLREGVLVDGRWMLNVIDGRQQAVVVTGGSQSITFELVNDKGITYTLSHMTDDFNVYVNPDTA